MKNRLHVKAPGNWVNDPNGMIYYKGQYHLLYQHFPYAPRWGTMHWGHAVSPDLIHWEHVGVALFPSLSEDQNGCFSGSAVEENGVMHLFYTGVHYNQVNPKDIHQCLDQDFTSAQLHLTSKDGMHFDVFGDKEVVIPALTDPEIGDNTHTRDPKVWKGSDAWYMVLGSTTKDHKGEALFYKSEDLSHWRLAGQATTKQKLGWMWECPDLFNVNGRSVFVFSPMELIEDTDGYADRAICMLPEFDEKTCTMKFPENWQLLDCGGDLYAPQTMTDADGNRISIAWLRMPEPVDGIWQGMFCMPRVVDVQNDHIYFRVLPAIRDGFCKKTDSLVSACGECAMIRAELKEGESLEIGGYKIWRQSGKVCADRTDVYPSGAKGWLHAETPQLKEGDLLEIFVDPNMIEIYANNGEYVLSQAVYGLGETFSYEMEKKPEIYLWNE